MSGNFSYTKPIMVPLTSDEIKAVAGGVNAGPDGKGCTEGQYPTDFFGKGQQSQSAQ